MRNLKNRICRALMAASCVVLPSTAIECEYDDDEIEIEFEDDYYYDDYYCVDSWWGGCYEPPVCYTCW